MGFSRHGRSRVWAWRWVLTIATRSTRPSRITRSQRRSGNLRRVLRCHGGFKIREIYGETRVPLISDQPGVHDLSVGSGFRVSNYSTFGSTPTYAFNVNYAPTEDVRFREATTVRSVNPACKSSTAPGHRLRQLPQDSCEGTTPVWTQQQCANTGLSAGEYGHVVAAPPASTTTAAMVVIRSSDRNGPIPIPQE